jgi:hypothetical protein
MSEKKRMTAKQQVRALQKQLRELQANYDACGKANNAYFTKFARLQMDYDASVNEVVYLRQVVASLSQGVAKAGIK